MTTMFLPEYPAVAPTYSPAMPALLRLRPSRVAVAGQVARRRCPAKMPSPARIIKPVAARRRKKTPAAGVAARTDAGGNGLRPANRPAR